MTAPIDLKTGITSKVAVLVDGENVSHAHANEILKGVETLGDPPVRRVYGNIGAIPEWEKVTEFRFVHTGSGKNSADIRLVIDAVDLAHSGGVETFVIVTSDGDFSHIAHYLRERGKKVIGLGEAKTSPRFSAACTRFVRFEKVEYPAPERKLTLDQMVCQVICEKAANNGFKITLLNAEMRRRCDVKISTLPDKNWRNYLENRKELFNCDPKGPNACVRLTRKGKAHAAS